MGGLSRIGNHPVVGYQGERRAGIASLGLFGKWLDIIGPASSFTSSKVCQLGEMKWRQNYLINRMTCCSHYGAELNLVLGLRTGSIPEPRAAILISS